MSYNTTLAFQGTFWLFYNIRPCIDTSPTVQGSLLGAEYLASFFVENKATLKFSSNFTKILLDIVLLRTKISSAKVNLKISSTFYDNCAHEKRMVLV